MKEYAKLYHLLNKPLIQLLRLSIFAACAILVGLTVTEGMLPKIPLFFLSMYAMLELFYHFRIVLVMPKLTVAKNDGKDISTSFTLQAMTAFIFGKTTGEVIQHMLHRREILFMLEKANIALGEIQFIDFLKDELAKEAFAIAKKNNGTYVTTHDLFAAYIIITETRTKLLFKKELKPDEFLHIAYWTRIDFPQEEKSLQAKVMFWGQGIGEDWVSGWTPETKKYIIDLTENVVRSHPILIGRKKEYEEIVEVLSKSVQNSVILIGEPGVGRTALVDAVVLHSFEGDLKGNLYHKRFYQLMVGPLLAGADTGELEARLQEVINELTHAGNIIVFIPEIENILGTSSFHVDLTGALLPYLRAGSIRIIATTTPVGFKNYVEPQISFTNVFESIHIEEPERDEAIQMLLEKTHEIEYSNNVFCTYKAVVAAVDLSRRFMHDTALPGAAVSLLSFAASSAAYAGRRVVDDALVIKKVEEKTHVAVATPTGTEKDVLLHLEEKMHERIIDQDEAITDIAQAIRRFRAGLSVGVKPISFLFLGPTGVGKTETAKSLASFYFGGEDKMIRLDMSEYQMPDAVNRLLGAPAGEGTEKGELTEKIHEHPYSLVLLDEFEKAHPDILNLFLQVLDDGRLTDNKGKTVSFASAIIIATSNAGSEFIREELAKGTSVDKAFHERVLEFLQTNGIFKPEMLNRFDGVIVFKPIGQNQALAISRLLLTDVTNKLQEQDITVTFDDKLLLKVAQDGFDQEFGARPLRRFIQENIEDLLARKILEGEIVRGAQIVVSTNEKGEIVITPFNSQ